MPGLFEGFDFSKMMENPEALAIGLDMAGQSIGGPTTPFGGVGTALGQSSLANKARIEQQAQMQQFREMLAQAFGGGTSTGGGLVGPPKIGEKSGVPMSDTTMALTPIEDVGPSKTTTKLDPKTGNTIRVTEEVVAKPEKNEYKSLRDFMSDPNF